MTLWATIKQGFEIVGYLIAVAGVLFLAGQVWQKIRRGEFGDLRLTPIQQIAQDVKHVQQQLEALDRKLDGQYTDVAQKVNAHHIDIRYLKDALNGEYERLAEKFHPKEFVDRRFVESEADRNKIHVELEAMRSRCDLVLMNRKHDT